MRYPQVRLDPNRSYHAATSAAHWLSATDRSLDAFAPVTVAQPVIEPPVDETPGEETPGEETPGEENPGEENPGEEQPGEETPVVETPRVEVVGDTTNLDPETPTTVTVKGSGFLENSPATSGTRRPLSGKFAGTYVIFGSFADTWKPSVGAPGSARVSLQQRWAVLADDFAVVGGAARGAIELTPEGTFETTLTLSPNEAKAVAGGSYGIVTYAAGGATYAPFETFTPVTFDFPEPATVSAQVTEASEVGLEIAVNVEGIELRAGADVPDSGKDDAGVYVGIIEEDRVDEYRTSASAGAAEAFIFKMFIADGTASTTMKVAAENLDRTKQYVAVSWLAHGFLSDSRFVAQSAVDVTEQDWDAVFGPADQPKITVTPAAELSDGDTVTVRGTGFNPDQSIYVTTCADIPLSNVSFGFISGCTDGAKLVWKQGMNRGVEFAADGSFELEMSVVQRGEATAMYTIADHTAMGDRSQDSKAVLSFGSSTSEPEPEPGEQGAVVRATATQVTPGKNVVAHVVAENLPLVDGFAYVAVIEKGTAASLNQDSEYPAMTPFAVVKDRKVSIDLELPATKLDRSKQYEVIVWQQHTQPAIETIYGQADLAITAAQWDRLLSKRPVAETPQKQPRPVGASQEQAGSLVWGVSQGFKDYITGRIAKGSISTNGVGASGGAYVFPQANGGSWNKTTQTGTMQFSGTVTFTGHHGLLVETFANPTITVTSATSGTLTTGGRTFGMNLAAATKTVGANGEVTWSGVPLSGVIEGGGSSSGGTGGGSFTPDPVSFTIGAANTVQYGATTVTEQQGPREAAATPPATTGITVLTDPEKLVPGGEIEFTAQGFSANERDILVVLYSDPIVLDEQAGANENGVVRWIGTLPEDLEPGEHTITLQGSSNAGAIITVVNPEKSPTVTTMEAVESQATPGAVVPISDGVAGFGTGLVWLWWIGAAALLALAAAMVGLVIHQRKTRA